MITVASVKAASEVAVIYFRSCCILSPKAVPNMSAYGSEPPLSEAVIGVEKVISLSCKLWSISVVKSSCSILWFQYGWWYEVLVPSYVSPS